MAQKEIQREVEAEIPAEINTIYEEKLRSYPQEIEQNLRGRKLIKGKQIPFKISRQGISRWYVTDVPPSPPDAVHYNWTLFVQQIPAGARSGRHVHQGGLNIFVIKGKGYTVIDGVRHDWSTGDLLALPIKKGGVEHQHFNTSDKPYRWLALIYNPYGKVMGRKLEQKELNPFWKEPVKADSK